MAAANEAAASAGAESQKEPAVVAAAAAAAARADATPSLAKQKSFIIENEHILDIGTKQAILRLVLLDYGGQPPPVVPGQDPVILEQNGSREITVDLDSIARQETIAQIYNVVAHRRATLNEPIRPPPA